MESGISENSFSLAMLKPDEVEEIRAMEQKMSEKVGHPISLIVYQADIGEDIASGRPN
ncbi:hypothetical protein ACFPPD_13670 [Cohnella suwonensis]|uniref:Uncharacterized protein n=1 Tax=Cohnella suwonensis TaxID=696072 RepID=A0ABW0LY22_9BACL